ncbi:protein phosphatase 2C [Tritrichomonas foetus]|uniref:Protein phosphatase 2C n=1 Tax=Tritrichomonas foetus TaxID=1144522 RepID=A0A1J4J9F5_9EUKA|nr:protein phosphatase 2C [Tritrichomonas foetus]|eukprot:OHS95826.1 protein phosphatase 2C [Tritrichomonas foetus]
MFSEPSLTPSTSLVLSNIPRYFDENTIREMFKETTGIDKIIFHYFGENLFLNTATIVFKTQEECKKITSKYFGKFIGEQKSILKYSLIPFIFSSFEKPGEINIRKPLDDLDVPTVDEYGDEVFSSEWNELIEFPSEKITKKHLQICLRFNLIQTLSNISFDNITYLNLKGNDIYAIDKNVHFPNLNECDLSFNKLINCPDFSSFSPKIKIFHVNNNNLENIHQAIISTSIKELNANDNKIDKIPDLPETLTSLVLNNNQIEIIGLMKMNKKLEKIVIDNNKLKEIPNIINTQKHVNLSFNSIMELNINFLDRNINSLILLGNQIKTVPSQLFSEFPNLTYLNLSNNLIHEIPSTFTTSKLVTFNISFNPISQLPKIPQSLTELFISFCDFKDISCFIPDDNQIEKLYANNNKIEKLPLFPFIEVLFLSSNKLKKMPGLTIPNRITASLDLSNNMIEGEINTQITPNFKLLDLSNNKITKVPISLFTRKSHIKLDENPIDMTLSNNIIQFIDSIDITHTNIKIAEDYSESIREIASDMSIQFSENTINNRISPNTSNLVFQYSQDHKIGYAEMIGERNDMEDAIIIKQRLFGPNIDLFGVFDGHNGRNAARFAAYGLPSILFEKFNSNKNINEICLSAISQLNDTLAFINDKSGCTLELVVLDKEKHTVDVTHLGDCRVLIITKGFSIKFATEDDRLENRCEMERLRSQKIPCRRMKTGGFLGVAASIGDHLYPGIRRSPITHHVELNYMDKWLIIGCDGVFEDVNNNDICSVLKTCETASQAAILLRDFAYERGSSDNISVIVVDLEN